jgi:hypothetical protein
MYWDGWKRLLYAAIGASLLCVTACTARSSSQAFHVWQLKGAVAAVDASSIRVRHKSGQIVVLTIDDRTTFVRDKQPASKDLLIEGTRVMVEVERRGAVDHALRVEICAGAKLLDESPLHPSDALEVAGAQLPLGALVNSGHVVDAL